MKKDIKNIKEPEKKKATDSLTVSQFPAGYCPWLFVWKQWEVGEPHQEKEVQEEEVENRIPFLLLSLIFLLLFWLSLLHLFFLQLVIFTRLESLSWSQQCFWQPSFCRNCNLWSFCCGRRTKVGFLCIACIQKRKKVETIPFFNLPSSSTHSLISRRVI